MAHTPYDIDVQVTVATALKEGFAVETRSMRGNPYDGHTLAEPIEPINILAQQKPRIVIKTDRQPGRNWLKGALDDALQPVMCGTGHDVR